MKSVTGYTGFSGAAAEQSGHYLALHFGATSGGAALDGATITVEIVNGHSGPVTLDSDRLWVGRIEDANRQSLRVIATKSGYSAAERILTLNGLTLE